MATELQEQVEEIPQEAANTGIKPMTDSELASVCLEEISRGIGGNVSSDSDPDISIALDYYFGRQPGITKVRAKDKNASRFVSQDVRDAVESTVAEIMPAFTSDQIGFYEPEDDRDEDASREESDIVNYLLMEEYDGYTLLQVAIKDALLHRNCTVKAFWDERVEAEYETFEDVPEMGLVDILTPSSENETIEVIEQYVSEEADAQAEAYIQSQQHTMDIQGLQAAAQDQQQQTPELQQGMEAMRETMEAAQDKYSIKIKRMKKVGKPVLKSLPPENVIVAGEHDSPYLHNCRFVAHELIETKSSLIAQGFDPILVNRLPEYNSNVENVSRSREAEESDYTSAHDSTKLVRIFECYINVDYDGDGIAERRKVILGNNEVMANDEWNDVAMIGGCATIMPHKYKGISLFERIKDIQDAKTPIMRSIIDGTQLSSNPRIGVVTGQGTNINDLLTSRTGGTVRTSNRESIFQIPNPEIPQSSYQFLEHMDTIRRDRGGGAVDTAAMVKGMDNASEGTVGRTMSALELTNALVARTIGETLVRGIFIELHNILRKNHKGSVSAKVGGQWIESIPESWRKRTRVSIQVGTSFAERARQSMVLNQVAVQQKEMAAIGSPLYSEEKYYMAISDSMRLSGIKSPERYWVQPGSDEYEQAKQKQSQQNQVMKQQEEAMQAQIANAQSKLAEAEQIKGMAQMKSAEDKVAIEGFKNQIEQLKTQLKSITDAAELQFKRNKQADDVALKLTELEVKAGKDLSDQNEDNREIIVDGEDESEAEDAES